MLLLNLCKILELSGPSVPVGTCYVFSVWGKGAKKIAGLWFATGDKYTDS